MLRGLQARVEKLEARQPKLPTRTHRLIQDGVDKETVLKRYEREAGVKIDPDDLVIVRVIVRPVDGRLG